MSNWVNIEQAASLYSQSAENIRRWCKTFAEFLSEDANPPDHRKRLLDDADLSALSLVAEMRTQGHGFDTIKAALAEGKRGAAPANPSAVVPADKTQLAKLKADVNRLTEALQVTIDENKELRGENKALREGLTRQLEAAQEKIEQLTGENAVLKYRLNKGD